MNTTAAAISIETFRPEYAGAFRSLNVAWIEQFFEMETSDYKALDHPQEYILDRGGEIFVALFENKVIGVCAMIKVSDTEYELAKMAVSEDARGKGAGLQLGNAAIEWARQRGAHRVVLDSNKRLEAAIQLYYKLGFRALDKVHSPYQRSDIQMVLELAH